MRNFKYKAGFTLVELMVVIAIFTIVLGASYALMSSGRMSWHSGDASIQLQENTRRAMDLMVRELSESASGRVNVGGAGAFITFDIPVDDNAWGSWEDTDTDGTADFYLGNTLDAATGDVEWGAYLRQEDRTVSSATLTFGSRIGRSIRFLRVGNELTRRVLNSGGAIIEDFRLADNIQSLNFVRVSAAVYRITIDSRRASVEQHPISYLLTTAVYLKN